MSFKMNEKGNPPTPTGRGGYFFLFKELGYDLIKEKKYLPDGERL